MLLIAHIAIGAFILLNEINVGSTPTVCMNCAHSSVGRAFDF